MLEIHILHIDFNYSNRLETIPPFPLQELQRFDLYFSAAVQMLIILRHLISLLKIPATFPCSDNPIFTYTFRFPL